VAILLLVVIWLAQAAVVLLIALTVIELFARADVAGLAPLAFMTTAAALMGKSQATSSPSTA
jgi:hypothetical protein